MALKSKIFPAECSDWLKWLSNHFKLPENKPFYIPDVPPFKLQHDIIDFADYDNDTDRDDCPLRIDFHWQKAVQSEAINADSEWKPIKASIQIQVRPIILHTTVIVTITKTLFPLVSPPLFRPGSSGQAGPRFRPCVQVNSLGNHE